MCVRKVIIVISLGKGDRLGSDHCPLHLSLDSLQPLPSRRQKGISQFEEAWCKELTCEELVKRKWKKGVSQL